MREFGKNGDYFFRVVRGLDKRPVNPNRIRKSIGRETTLQIDISDKNKTLEILSRIAGQVDLILKKSHKKGKTVTLKIRYADFKTVTRSRSLMKGIDDAETIMVQVKELLEATEINTKKVRLLGITLSNFSEDAVEQIVQLNFPFY